jgi:hypothetical protein
VREICTPGSAWGDEHKALCRLGDGNGLSVTFPARQFTFHGERRDFALLRAIEDPNAQNQVRELVLQAYRAEVLASENARAS